MHALHSQQLLNFEYLLYLVLLLGFSGPDCSQRVCKHGVDPLYLDDGQTIRYSIYNFAVLHTSLFADTISSSSIAGSKGFVSFTDGMYPAGEGHWAIRFFDMYGEDWLTEPIVAGATCGEVLDALYRIPNNVIPPNSLECVMIDSECHPRFIFTFMIPNPF